MQWKEPIQGQGSGGLCISFGLDQAFSKQSIAYQCYEGIKTLFAGFSDDEKSHVAQELADVSNSDFVVLYFG